MAITSLDILNLSHSLKDLCDVNCKQTECLTQTLQILLEYNLIQANLEFSRQFACPGDSRPFYTFSAEFICTNESLPFIKLYRIQEQIKWNLKWMNCTLLL